MACAHRTLSARIPAEPATVRAFYVDLDNLRSLHPFLAGVETIERTALADGYVHTYRVRERIPLGPVTLPIRFRARLTVPHTGDVLAESFQFPRVRLRSVVSFEPEGDGTLLTERIRFGAPWPLAGVTVREGMAAHRQMLAGIAAHFA